MTTRRALLASLAALGATADRGAVPPGMNLLQTTPAYAPTDHGSLADMEAALITHAMEKFPGAFLEDERVDDEAEEKANAAATAQAQHDDLLRKRARRSVPPEKNPTVGDAALSVFAGKVVGGVVGALLDAEDDLIQVGPGVAGAVGAEYWDQLKKKRDEEYVNWLMREEAAARAAAAARSAKWDADWSLNDGDEGGSRKKKSRKKKMCKKKSRKKKGARRIR